MNDSAVRVVHKLYFTDILSSHASHRWLEVFNEISVSYLKTTVLENYIHITHFRHQNLALLSDLHSLV